MIDLGAVGGLAVIQGVCEVDSQTAYSYRAMQLIHQHVRGRTYRGTRGMKEHSTREFKHARDLYIRPPGRLVDNERDVLPDDVGLNTDGKGHRLSVAQLIECGRQAAKEAGYTNPTSPVSINFALYEMAKRNPLALDPQEVRRLAKLALFDIDEEKVAPSRKVLEYVTERLLETIHGHLNDSQTSFDGWFSGPRNSLVKQIAQQKKQPGGRLPRQSVRQALLYLGWESYRYVGQCVHALMRTIKNSLPEPLSDEERRLYERMHESQWYYGGLPLALLAERASFLRRAILAIWDEPSQQKLVHVLHRLLAYYAEMACKRRGADRESKRRSGCHGRESSRGSDDGGKVSEYEVDDEATQGRTGDQHSHLAIATEFIDSIHVPSDTGKQPFNEIADHIRRSRSIDCQGGCTSWEYRVENGLPDGESPDPVSITVRCECGRVETRIDVSRDEFTEAARETLGWELRTS